MRTVHWQWRSVRECSTVAPGFATRERFQGEAGKLDQDYDIRLHSLQIGLAGVSRGLMMKGRVLLLLVWVVLAPSIVHALDIFDLWERLKQPQEVKDIIALSRISLAYELVHEGWISFEAPIRTLP